MVSSQAETLSVNLRWSLWSSDLRDYWPAGAIGRMLSAFDGTAPRIVVITSPSRESFTGRVEIGRGWAQVDFATRWVTVPELLDEYELRDEQRERFEPKVDAWLLQHGRAIDPDGNGVVVGAAVSGTVIRPTFQELMAEIDRLELRLHELDAAHERAFDEFICDLMLQEP